MRPPRDPDQGDDVLDYCQELAAAIRAIWPQPGGDISPQIGADGTSFSLQKRSALTSKTYEPFEVRYGGKDDTAHEVVLLIREGTLNGLSSGDIDVVCDETDSPDGWWKFLVSPSTTKYAEQRATFDASGNVTARRLSLVTTPTAADASDSSTGAPPAHSYRTLFEITTDGIYGAAFNQYMKGAHRRSSLWWTGRATRSRKKSFGCLDRAHSALRGMFAPPSRALRGGPDDLFRSRNRCPASALPLF